MADPTNTELCRILVTKLREAGSFISGTPILSVEGELT